MKHYIRKNWKLLLNVVTLLALGLSFYLLRDDIAEVWSNLGRLNIVALLLVVPLQIMNYSCWTHVYQEFLHIIAPKESARIRFRELYKMMLELNFVNTVFPTGGVSGFTYLQARLKPEGISTAQATLAQGMRLVLTFVSFIALLFAGLFMLSLGGNASNMTILITCSFAFCVLFTTVIGVYTISSKQRIHIFSQSLTKAVNKMIHILWPKKPEMINLKKVEKGFGELHENYMLINQNWRELRRPLLYSLLGNITELATIYVVYMAHGEWVNPGAIIIAYAVANFAGLIAILPGGIGVYEGLMTGVMVSAGVPAALSLSVTLIYRILNMGLSLPIGYFFYHQSINKLGSGVEQYRKEKKPRE